MNASIVISVINSFRFDVFKEQNVKSSLFRALMLRGDIPCQRAFCKPKDNKYGTVLMWKIAPQDLDYSCYLPVFFDGWDLPCCIKRARYVHLAPIIFNFFVIRLCEATFPYNMLASYGIHDLLDAGSNKVLPVIPQLIIPIKNALNTKNQRVIAATLRVIQHLCMCGEY